MKKDNKLDLIWRSGNDVPNEMAFELKTDRRMSMS